MAAVAVDFRQDVEEKRLHIKVQRFVVQEQFGDETQVLAVNLQVHHKPSNIYEGVGWQLGEVTLHWGIAETGLRWTKGLVRAKMLCVGDTFATNGKVNSGCRRAVGEARHRSSSLQEQKDRL